MTGGEYFGDDADPPNIVTFLGNDLQLNCSDVSNMATSPIWQKTAPQGTVVNITNAVEKYDLNQYSLTIVNTTYNDAGLYTCIIPGSNSTHRIHVTVIGEWN